jgi:amino acid permease
MALFSKRLRINVITFIISSIILIGLFLIVFSQPQSVFFGTYFGLMFTLMRHTVHIMEKNAKKLNDIAGYITEIEQKFDDVLNKKE